MTEETTNNNQGMNISVEQILAAIVSTVGEVNIPLEALITNYSNKSISVNQNEDKSVTFALVDLPEATEAPVEAAE